MRTMFVAAFFPGKGGLVMTLLYMLGIVLGIVVAHFYNRTIFKGDPTPLVIELPNYRIPSPKNRPWAWHNKEEHR